MRKSMIATAVVATAGLAASANAGWFQISSASVQGSGATSLTTPTGTYAPNSSSAAFDLSPSTAAQAGANFTYTGSANNTYTLSGTDANNVAWALGNSGPIANGTLAYFGFEGSSAGPGFFGVCFVGTGSIIDFTFANANVASLGVYSNVSGVFASNTWETNGAGISTTAGQAYVIIFAGIGVNASLGSGLVSDSGLNVRYLNYGTSWNVVGSANNVSSSNLNVATYQVPVPAPALLAGAGLVGAAALRRRMAKKA